MTNLVDRERQVGRGHHVLGDRPGAGEHALVVEIGAAEGGDHVRLRKRAADVDPGEAGVRVRAAQDREVHHAGQVEVVRPPGLAGDEAGVLLAQPGPTDLWLADGRGHAPTSAGLAGTASGAAVAPAPLFAAAWTARTMF